MAKPEQRREVRPGESADLPGVADGAEVHCEAEVQSRGSVFESVFFSND